jgi:hypothetical protein
MFVRYVWVDPGPTRRYCLALVALAMFHVPRGGEIMAHWIDVGVRFLGKRRIPIWLSERFWFYVLATLALGPMCLPKLVNPLSADKEGYRRVARWLRTNTDTKDVIAVPDVRISFYAEREGWLYDRYPDPKKAGFVVTIATAEATSYAPRDWREMYSVGIDQANCTRLTVYRTPLEEDG